MTQNRELQMISVQRSKDMESGYRRGITNTRKRKRRRAKRRRLLITYLTAILLVAVCFKTNWFTELPAFGTAARITALQLQGDYPTDLLELLEQNEETYEFVKDYPSRAEYTGREIDLSGDAASQTVPLLMQWDKRWGYDLYGDAMIGLSGCGPTCMTMAYLHFTGDTGMNPRRMAEFAQDSGYHSTEGTSWEFWTAGAASLGLSGETISLSETVMKGVLDNGGLIVCSMSPGDFTTGGHYILLRGYDENGFFVNDPNRKSNSKKQWDYDTLASQMKNLWALYKNQ